MALTDLIQSMRELMQTGECTSVLYPYAERGSDYANAPTLDYGIPQATCFDAYSYLVVNLPAGGGGRKLLPRFVECHSRSDNFFTPGQPGPQPQRP